MIEYPAKKDSLWKYLSCNRILIVLNVLIFLIVDFTGSSLDARHMLDCGAAYAPYIDQGQYFRLFTCMFLHFGIEHLGNNMLVLYVVGERLEKAVGHVRYALIYLLGGVAGNLVSWMAQRGASMPPVSAGASGAVFAAMGGMLAVLLVNRGRIQNLTIRQMAFMALLALYYGFASEGVDNWAHGGGLLFGFLITLVLYHQRRHAERR